VGEVVSIKTCSVCCNSQKLGDKMSLAKFRKVFKGHKKPDPPSTKVFPENTDQKKQGDK